MRGLINLFSKDIFEADHGGDDLIGRVYEYFIGEFASSEGKRGGEYFTPISIVKTLVAMLEPDKGVLSRAKNYRGWAKAPSRFLVEMELVKPDE